MSGLTDVVAAGIEARGRVTQLGRYEMLTPIASGGMASVWAARLIGTSGFRKIVAIKSMLPDLADEPDYREMFLDEARIASKLRHPNVCETFDLGEQDGELFMAMEWVDGVSLHRLLRDSHKHTRPIAPEIGARIVAHACAGLHAAHEATDDDGAPLAIVHRDVSPHNLLVSVAGHVKVTDFGVAKARNKSHRTAAGQAKGKLAYMAPEQLRLAGAVDRRADVFSLGCVLYEASTGQKPFDAVSDVELMRAILERAPKRPSEILPGYPAELERIIVRAMAKDPSERFASAEGLRLALDRWLAGRVTERDIAAIVHERCGSEIETRRAAIHASCNDAGRASPGIEAAPRPKPDRVRHATIALGLAVIALGFGSLFVHRTFSSSEVAHEPAPVVSVTHVAEPELPQSAKAIEAMPAAPEASSHVTFRVDPPNATVVVDGDVLTKIDEETGAFAVERPTSGEMRVLLVKAPGHVDRLLVIDKGTPPTVEVSLASIDKSSVL